jgi:hypothetical protein
MNADGRLKRQIVNDLVLIALAMIFFLRRYHNGIFVPTGCIVIHLDHLQQIMADTASWGKPGYITQVQVAESRYILGFSSRLSTI